MLDVDPEVLGRPASEPARRPSGSLEEIEADHILRVLGQTGWVIEGPQGAAAILGLHPNTLRSRLKKLGLRDRPTRIRSSHDGSWRFRLLTRLSYPCRGH